MAVGGAPEAGGLGAAGLFGLLGLSALAGMLACRGGQYAWNHTVGAIMHAVAGAFNFSVLGFRVHLGAPIDNAADAVPRKLGKWAATFDYLAGYSFHEAAYLIEWTAHLIEQQARTVYGWAEWLQGVHLPRWAKWTIRAAFPLAYLTKLAVSEIRRELPHLLRVAGHVAHVVRVEVTRTIVKPVEHRVTVIERVIRGKAASVGAVVGAAGVIAWEHVHVLPRIKRIERGDLLTRKRLRRLEKLLGAAGLAYALARALGLGTVRCLRDGNVGKAARAICGMNPSLIESLLADGLAIIGALSVVEFATELRAVEDEAVKILGGLVKEWPSA